VKMAPNALRKTLTSHVPVFKKRRLPVGEISFLAPRLRLGLGLLCLKLVDEILHYGMQLIVPSRNK